MKESYNRTVPEQESTLTTSRVTELKPEGEGENEASKKGESTYKNPLHGEETATTARKYLLMSGSFVNVKNHLDGKPNHGVETMIRSNLDFTYNIIYTS